MSLHGRDVQCIPSGQLILLQKDFPSPVHNPEINGKHLVHDSQNGFEGRLDRISASGGVIPVQKLLENFRIGHQPLASGDHIGQQPHSFGFVGMICPHEVHGDV